MESERMAILNRVKAGEITIDEGARLLSMIDEGLVEPAAASKAQINAVPSPVVHQAAPEDLESDRIHQFRSWWLAPLWIGFSILVFSAGLMSWGLANAHFFWFYCSWLPLLIGLLMMVIGAWSRTARWLHLRVQDTSHNHSSNIRLSFPIPIRFAGWVFHTAAPYIPQIKEQGWVDSVVPLLETVGNSREPMVIEVNENEGQNVQIYFL